MEKLIFDSIVITDFKFNSDSEYNKFRNIGIVYTDFKIDGISYQYDELYHNDTRKLVSSLDSINPTSAGLADYISALNSKNKAWKFFEELHSYIEENFLVKKES